MYILYQTLVWQNRVFQVAQPLILFYVVLLVV
jgi:hypothetical protein